MADERLRLVAEVTDQFTAPLGRMETALRRTGNAARETAGQVKRDWEPLQGAIGKTTTVLQGMLTPLTALGAGSLTAGLGITGMVSALRGFTASTRDLSLMSKEVGLTVDQLRGLNRMGDEFGISADRMQGGVRTFAENMSQIRKRYGDAYMALQGMNMGELVEKLVAAPNMKAAMEAAAEEIGKLGDPVRGRKVAETLLGLPEFRSVAAEFKERFGKVWGETIADIGKIGPETEKAARDFERNMGKIGDAAERLKLKTLGPIVRGLNSLIEDGDKNGLAGDESEQDLRRQLSPLEGAGPDARARLEGRRSQIQQQLDLLNRNPNAPDFERKRDRMVEELRRVGDELEKLRAGGATPQQMSFMGSGGGGSLIHKAGWGGLGFGRGAIGGGFGGGGFPVLTDESGAPVAGPRGGGLGSGGGSNIPIFPKTTAPAGGGGAGGADDVTVLGKRLRYSAFSGSGRARVNSWLTFFQKPVNEGGLGMPVGRAQAMVAMMQGESGENLNPGAVGDHGTAFGTAQWRLDRFSALKGVAGELGVPWTDVHAQQQHLRREMLGRYNSSYNRIMNAPTDEEALYAGIRHFENPKDPRGAWHYRMVHLNRLRKYGMTGEGGDTADSRPWYERPRSNVPGQMSRIRDDEIDVPGGGERPGDAMMRRMYGGGAGGMQVPGAPVQEHRLTIDFPNAPAGMKATPKMGSLFKDTTMRKSRQLNGSVFA